MVKGRKCNAPAAEFVVKMSNRFDILMEEEETKNSSSKEVIKSSKPVVQRNNESTNVKQMKALELTKKYSNKHSSSRSSKFFGQVSDKKQGVFNQSITNWAVQSSRSKDCVGVTESTKWFPDQHSTIVEHGYKVSVRKLNKNKATFKFKTVEMVKDDSLKQFETVNPFKWFETLDEDCLEDAVSEVNMKSEPKHLLKKCRYCNYKKRSCDVDSFSCVAWIKKCFKCGKRGHYPQSMCCKASKSSQKVKLRLIDNQDMKQPTEISKEMLHLIKYRISQIECNRMTSIRKSVQHSVKEPQQRIPLDLIPFLMFYILLHYDSLINPKSLKRTKMSKKQVKNSKDLILKTANYCARKFVNPQHQTKKHYFLDYCIKKAGKLNKAEVVLKTEKRASFQSILNVFDRVFYNEQENVNSDACDQTNFLLSQFDEENDLDFDESVQSTGNIVIPPFDGGNDNESSQEDSTDTIETSDRRSK